MPSPEMNSFSTRTPESHWRATISRSSLAFEATSICPPSPRPPAPAIMLPLGMIARTRNQPTLDRLLGEHVIKWLQDTGTHDERVTALEEGLHHGGDVERMLAGRRGGHPRMVEHEVQRPAAVDVGIPEARQDRRLVDVDDPRRLGHVGKSSRRDLRDGRALDQDVAGDGSLIRGTAAREDARVAQENAVGHVPPSSPFKPLRGGQLRR